MNKQIVINKLLVSYFESGSNDSAGDTILFLHGWRSQKEIWHPAIREIAKFSGNKIYALDLPGFGGSQPSLAALSVEDYAKIVAGFITKLNLKKNILVGHSFGGRIGIKLASCYPELIHKLILVDSAGFTMAPGKKKTLAFAAKIAKPFFKPKFMQTLRKKIYQKIGSEDYLETPKLRETYIKVIGEDLSPYMKKIKCPTLIITGENDLDTPVDFGKKMNSLIPNSKFLILNNAGHFSFLDKPSEFIELLKNFIS